ncbi:inositol monophosphatase family protein [Lentisphaera marina]|uniref:inositol monophosphatase family protein n=1 Tax=Lentisphaera marina TaxID=1111041 RepID=UPI002367154D|nr:inositol monophosphatase family protein [Lentisphaera marina]MDD7984503.1 inositol monophosphatase family protein [Lentisphaera marina]
MRLNQDQLCELSKLAIQAAKEAGQLIQSYTGKALTHEFKLGASSKASEIFTEVDLKAEKIIIETLKPSLEKFDLALLAEESTDDGQRHIKDAFWCIDPLDGTLPFTEGIHGYSVSIALVAKDGSPLIGVIYDPVKDDLYHAIKEQGIFKNQLPWKLTNESSESTFYFMCDRSFYENKNFATAKKFIHSLSEKLGCNKLKILHQGGGAMNAVLTLSHKHACYFKLPKVSLGGGSLWDFAASANLFQEAQKPASNIHGNKLDLNRTDSTFMNHEGVLYASSEEISQAIQSFHKKDFK